MGLFSWFKKSPKPTAPARNPFHVDVDSECIVLHDERDDKERIAHWAKIDKIYVFTTDEGPQANDIYFCFHCGPDIALIVPSEARGADELITRLLALPGFNEEEFIRGMGSTDNHKFLCWVKT